jgi:ferredoxin
MPMAARLEAMGQEKYRGLTRRSGNRSVWTGKIRLDEKSLLIPHTWTRSRFVFVNSMSDLFHSDVPSDFIGRVWQVMGDTPRHTYQILTKRPDRMLEIVPSLKLLPNVWLGTSVEADGAPPILDAAEEAGVLMPSGCRMGICYGCVLPLREGAVRDLRTGEVTTAVPGDGVLVQTCISAAAGACDIDH